MLIATKFEAKLGDTVTSYLNPKQPQAGQEFKVIFSCRASSRPAQAQEKKLTIKVQPHQHGVAGWQWPRLVVMEALG